MFLKTKRTAISLVLAAGHAGGFGSTFANDLLKLIFQATAIANIADNAASAPLTALFLSLHTASPSGAGQTTSEAAYTSYARVSVARTSGGFTISTNTAALVALTSFPAATGGSETETHFGVGTLTSGAGKLLFWGTISPNIVVSSGVTPQLTTAAFLTLAT
jgi:hypothetical protein